MLFNSVRYLIFFPVVVMLYFLIPQRVRWIWLLVTSFFFYASWNVYYLFLMLVSILTTYLCGVLVDHTRKRGSEKSTRICKLWVALCFAINLLILFFFKYFLFLMDGLVSLFTLFNVTFSVPRFDVLLPVGISFYTFQALGYIVDVYRGDVAVEKNPARYALFVSFFPQLVAGPIERSKNLITQLYEPHYFSFHRIKRGLMLILWGLFQKIVIADRVALYVNTVYDNYQGYAGFEIAIATILFAFQIYCDFSGYSDIAQGSAEVLGFKLMDNFRAPYFSTSIRDFWSRWHISLSTWFKDYLYIPLGGNRKGKLRTNINTMITFLVSGLWHGASWNYVIWGALHGGYQIIGRILAKPKQLVYERLKIKTDVFSFRLGKCIITFILVDFAWIFFRAKSGNDAIQIIKRMFSSFNPWILFNGSVYHFGLDYQDSTIMYIAIAVLLIVNYTQGKFCIRDMLDRQNMAFRWIVCYVAIFVLILFGVYGPTAVQTQFIYFQF